MATAIQLKLFRDFFFMLIAATNHHSMSDEGEQPREKAAQRPSKKCRNHALGLKMISMFSRLQCLHGSFWYESRGWSWFFSRAWEEACLWTYLSIGPMQIEEENQVFWEDFCETRKLNNCLSCSSDGVALPPADELSTAGEYGRLIIWSRGVESWLVVLRWEEFKPLAFMEKSGAIRMAIEGIR